MANNAGTGGTHRQQLTALLQSGGTVADYDATLGITGTTNASAWANQIGIAGPLLQATGSAQPTIEADGSLLFDGATQFMKAAAFTLIQPTTIYLVVKQVTWVINDAFCDGNTNGTLNIFQNVTTPQIALFAGAVVAGNNNFAVGSYGVVTGLFSGASSLLKVDGTAATTGNPGAGNAGGFNLGSNSTPAGYSNIQVKRVIARNVADSAATQARIQALLKSIYGTP